MKKHLLLFWLLGYIVGSGRTTIAQTIDPSPNLTVLNRPVEIKAAMQQADGKHVVVGHFSTVEGQPSGGLARYNADHSPDATFNTNVAALRGPGWVDNVRQLPSGKLLLIGPDSIRIGNVVRRNLMRLNPDGTPDATFNAGAGATLNTIPVIRNSRLVTAVQPDGKILVGGDFLTFSGVTANRIVRLLPDGALDPTFTQSAALNATVKKMVLQPDGKIMVAGYFSTLRRVVRLLPTGAVDNTFTSPVGNYSSTLSGLDLVGLQPDGKIIIAGNVSINGVIRYFARLHVNGSLDATFLPPSTSDYSHSPTNPYDASSISVLADGRIVLSGSKKAFLFNNTSHVHGLICLNANGTISNTLNNILLPDTRSGYIGASEQLTSLSLQANGQWLVTGNGKLLNGQRSYVALLNADGTHDATFNPNLLGPGYISSTAQQADGRLLVVGDFDELNGVRARYLARLNLDGTVDAAFSSQNNLRYETSQVAVTSTGKILVASDYGKGLERLLSNGAPDLSFVASIMTAGSEGVSQLLQQPDGRILVVTQLWSVQRLLPDGQFDISFAPYNDSGIRSIALQADGKVVVAGNLEYDPQLPTPTRNVIRLLPNGQRDPSFTELGATGNIFIQAATLQSDGKIIVSASSARNGVSQLLRLLPNGQPDASFTPMLARYTNDGFMAVRVQADDRIVATIYNHNSLTNLSEIRRFMADGQPDNTFTPVGLGGYSTALLIQTDGKIVAAGNYLSVNGTPRLGLVRLIPANALATHAPQPSAPQIAAWPSPAHDELRVVTTRPAQMLTLLTLQGQTVQRQEKPATDAVLDLRHLPAGVYLLRVEYAAGPVTRRIVIE